MSEYNKIETIFERDIDGTKKLIVGKYRNKTVEMLKDIDWVWTEKIDGTNTRIYWDGHNISFKGRTEKSNIPKELMEYLTRAFMNNETEELFEQLFGDKQVVLYGEGYGGKIQNGVGYRTTESFILFDVMVNDIYLERINVNAIADAIGIRSVPIVGAGNLDDAVEYVRKGNKSHIGDADMEGIVCRPSNELFDRQGKRLIVKIKYKDFEH